MCRSHKQEGGAQGAWHAPVLGGRPTRYVGGQAGRQKYVAGRVAIVHGACWVGFPLFPLCEAKDSHGHHIANPGVSLGVCPREKGGCGTKGACQELVEGGTTVAIWTIVHACSTHLFFWVRVLRAWVLCNEDVWRFSATAQPAMRHVRRPLRTFLRLRARSPPGAPVTRNRSLLSASRDPQGVPRPSCFRRTLHSGHRQVPFPHIHSNV